MKKIIFFTILSLFLIAILAIMNHNIESHKDVIKKTIEEKKQLEIKDPKEERKTNIYSYILNFDESNMKFETVHLKKDKENNKFEVKFSCSPDLKNILSFLESAVKDNDIKEIEKININKNNDKNREFDICVNFNLD